MLIVCPHCATLNRVPPERTGASPATSARFGVRSIPTMVMLRAGQEAKRQAGAVQAAQIVAWASTT